MIKISYTLILRHQAIIIQVNQGRIFLNKGKEKVVAFFGDIHPGIIKKLDIKVEALVGFEIFLDNIKQPNKVS